jgi:sugar/nucleoside kinase (ribokinase family)
VVCLPDGSVDTLARVRDGSGSLIGTRAAFGERVGNGSLRSVTLEELAREPGGQSVNAAGQVHALGGDVALFGHLDDPVFDLPFETYSMGEPAAVTVLRFDREDLMLSRASQAIDRWSFETLLSLDAPVRERIEAADACCLANWASFGDLSEGMRDLADWDLDGPVVLDPGPLGGGDGGALRRLCDALATLDGTCPVVLSANEGEIATLATVLGIDAEDHPARERALRAALGVSGVVFHGDDAAVAATGASLDGPATAHVPNIEVTDVCRRTGAGDRFSGGLAAALGTGLDIEVALAMGNACASCFVASGETADRERLAAFVADRSPEA